MQANNTATYVIRINERQRSQIATALLAYICEGGFQGRATPEEIKAAEELMSDFSVQNGKLKQGSIINLSNG